MRSVCRHCHHKYVNRPRGLCFHCFYAPGVRDLYPTCSKYGRRGVPMRNEDKHPLPTPTACLPGTEAKVEVLEARALAGEQLFSPLDARDKESDGPRTQRRRGSYRLQFREYSHSYEVME